MRAISFVLGCGLLACACARSSEPESALAARVPCARAWPEADALFKRDPTFRGADAAISVALDAERTLWLFGDSFVATSSEQARSEARFVHNSVAIMRGRDPSGAAFRLYVGGHADGGASSFFADGADDWVWPGDGVLLDHALTIFLERMHKSEEGALGFRSAGWTLVRIRNPDAEPDAWVEEILPVPDTGKLGIVGAAIVVDEDHVIAYAVEEPGSHAVMLLRWSLAEFERGELLSPEYFMGERAGWGAGPPVPVIANGATEFSVSRTSSSRYVQVQSRGFGAAPIALRFARSPEGPFGAPLEVYMPPEATRPHILLYAARAHPELLGADLVLTYASNSLEPGRVVADTSLYFPRFVRLDWRSACEKPRPDI